MVLGTIKCDREDVAFIIAGLVREGVTFIAYEGKHGVWSIELTGGF